MRLILTIAILTILGCTKTILDLTDPKLAFPDRKPTLEKTFTVKPDSHHKMGINDLHIFGDVILASTPRTLTAFSASADTELWHTELSEGTFGSQIQVHGDKIYSFAVNADLLVLDLATGQLLEQRIITSAADNETSWITYHNEFLYFIDYEPTGKVSYENLVFYKYKLDGTVKEEFFRIDSVYTFSKICGHLSRPMILDSKGERIFISIEFCNHPEFEGGKYVYNWKNDSFIQISESVDHSFAGFENLTLVEDRYLIHDETDNKTVGLNLNQNKILWRKGQGGGSWGSVFPAYFATYVFNGKLYSWDEDRNDLNQVDHLTGNSIWKQSISSHKKYELAMINNSPYAFFISTLTTGGKSIPVIRVIDMNNGRYLIAWGGPHENTLGYFSAVLYSPIDNSCYVAANKTLLKYKLPNLN